MDSQNKKFSFEVVHQYKKARIGLLATANGTIETPVFMPVGTNGAIKCMKIDDLYQTKAQIILANTYHLMLRPGAEIINELGGLHKFNNCKLPILTDSGGFQVMSLSHINTIKKDGVLFKSHIDGKKYFLTPELSTHIQYLLGSDITMTLDICTKEGADYLQAEQDMEITTQWAKKCRINFKKRDGFGQFGIIQGNTFKNLRKMSAQQIIDLDFEGYAIGGVILGKDGKILFETLDYAADLLPYNKPKYVMGIGLPTDLIGAVKRGIDMFDCVLPTRAARHGLAFTTQGRINIRNSSYIKSKNSLDDNCSCYVCKDYCLGYLNHLFKCKEILGPILLTHHNTHYFQHLMIKIRNYIKQDKDFDFTC